MMTLFYGCDESQDTWTKYTAIVFSILQKSCLCKPWKVRFRNIIQTLQDMRFNIMYTLLYEYKLYQCGLLQY